MKRLKKSLDVLSLVVVLGVFAWVWQTGSGTGRHGAESATEEAALAVSDLESALATNRYTGHPCEVVLTRVEQCPREVQEQWTGANPAGKMTGPLFYHPSALDDLRNDVDLEIRFYPPKELSALADIGEIRLGWASDEASTVDVVEYIVYRAAKGLPQVEVARLPGSESAWLDANVQPGVLYTYAIAARTDEPLLVRDGKDTTNPSSAVSEYGKRDYEIHPIAWDADRKQLRVRLRKYHGGVWREKEFTATKGGPIGSKDPGSGVNYGTGCILTDVKVAHETTKETVEHVVFDAQGMVVVEGGVAQRRSFERDKIRRRVSIFYKNEVGGLERRALVDDDGE